MYRVLLALLCTLVLAMSSTTTAKADEPEPGGAEAWHVPYTWNFDVHVFRGHYGYAGPQIGNRNHINWVLHYHPWGYWNNWGRRNMANIHASGIGTCVCFWDSVSGARESFCKPNAPNWDALVDSLADDCDRFARNSLHIYLPFFVYTYLAYALLCFAWV